MCDSAFAGAITSIFDAHSSASIVSPLSEGERFLLYPAQFWPHKNHVGLLDAVAALERTGENQFESLLFVGADKGNLKFVKDYASSLKLKTNIHFMGFVDRKALLQLFSQARLLVFPSFFGPDNLPPIEAMGLGCPVCVADVPGAREQLDDLAWYFDPANPDDIASQLQLVLAMTPEEREKRVALGMALNKTLTGRNYLKAINAVLDKLTPKVRCWEAGYFHTNR
jgi:glycosyltransferase involved in cell wall biosynthesis